MAFCNEKGAYGLEGEDVVYFDTYYQATPRHLIGECNFEVLFSFYPFSRLKLWGCSTIWMAPGGRGARFSIVG
jgi:hypothetical protein